MHRQKAGPLQGISKGLFFFSACVFAVLKTGSGETKVALELVDHLDLEGQRNIPHGNRGTEEMAPPHLCQVHRNLAPKPRWLKFCVKRVFAPWWCAKRFSTPMWLGCGTCSQTNVVILTSFTVEDSIWRDFSSFTSLLDHQCSSWLKAIWSWRSCQLQKPKLEKLWPWNSVRPQVGEPSREDGSEEPGAGSSNSTCGRLLILFGRRFHKLETPVTSTSWILTKAARDPWRSWSKYFVPRCADIYLSTMQSNQSNRWTMVLHCEEALHICLIESWMIDWNITYSSLAHRQNTKLWFSEESSQSSLQDLSELQELSFDLMSQKRASLIDCMETCRESQKAKRTWMNKSCCIWRLRMHFWLRSETLPSDAHSFRKLYFSTILLCCTYIVNSDPWSQHVIGARYLTRGPDTVYELWKFLAE